MKKRSESFALFFAGAEVTTHRKLLTQEGALNVSLNFLYLKSASPWTVAEKFSPRQKVLIDSGAATISEKEWTQEAHDTYLEWYSDFVYRNLPALSYVVEADFTDLSYDWVESQRKNVWVGIPPEKLVPVWHEQWGDKVLREMIGQYPNIGVPPLSKAQESRLSGLVRSSGVNLFGLCYNHPYKLQRGLYRAILSTSWISPSKFGETVVWDHNRLRRYSNSQKVQARRRHRHQIIEAGFDPDLFDVPKSNELSRYTIWAWKRMENSMQPPKRVKVIGKTAPRLVRKPLSTNGAHVNGNGNGVRSIESVDNDIAEVLGKASNGSHLPALRSDLKVMPGFGFRTVTTTVKSQVEGEADIQVQQRMPALADVSCRKCDSCSLASNCAAFTSGSNCAYFFPVEIRTRDQLMGTMNTFLEMQAQRVAFARMSEDVNGGYPDPNLSMEIDRFYRIIYGMKKITEDTNLFKLNIEAQGPAAGGILSKIFGAGATAPLRQVDPTKAEGAVREAIR